MDSVALCEDVLLHLGMPASGLMSKMDASFKEHFHCDAFLDWHWRSGMGLALAGGGGNAF